jgi:hypothetical protein
MKTLTPRDLRNAVLLTALITAVVMLALLDPSCRPAMPPDNKPMRSTAP